MNKLLIATHNPAKKQELGEGFASYLVETGHALSLQTLDDLHISADPEETGKTFAENAELKAKYFAKLSNSPTVADDGGIEIDFLNGQPGVHSKRWLGRVGSDNELIKHTLEQLKDIPLDKRTAQFTVCLSYFNPHTGFGISVTESLKGHIALLPCKQFTVQGFPYRALFIVELYKKYYDELTQEQHGVVNHRVRAIKKILPFIKRDLIQ